MAYLKSIAAGVAGAVGAIVLSIFVAVAYSSVVYARHASDPGIHSYSVNMLRPWTLLAGIAGFGIAFMWERRRTERQRQLH